MKIININIGFIFVAFLCVETLNAQHLRLGGNTNLPAVDNITTPGNNIVGSNAGFNVPIIVRTNGVSRIQFNANLTSATTNAATPQNKDGFIGINTTDPWSRLTLFSGAYTPCGGYRPWHREGINIQTNNDQFWFGHKSFGNPDQQNATINWSDDPGSSGAGPDHFVINFTATSGNLLNYPSPGVNPNAQTLDGREMMRITDGGNVGIGARFNNTFAPSSNLHIHQHNDVSSWMQISNQYMANNLNTNIGPTTFNANDGLRFGILGQNTLIRNGNGFLYNQEDRHLIFSTGNVTPANINSTRERVRITHIGAPTNILSAPFYDIHNPANLPLYLTRVAISHDPTRPITRPLSLLHLGYNTNNDTLNNTYDGWRNWMDVGMFVSRPFDHVYIGHKQEGFADRADAIIGWGNEVSGFAGPDVLRFIFTQTFNPSSNQPSANLNDGLECMRIFPGRDTTSINLFPNYTTWGRVGIGDFSVNGLNGGPTHKLDVDGNGRFRLLPDSLYLADTSVKKYVMVDETGVLRWGSINLLGNYCGLPTNTLLDDYEIDLGDKNIFFRRGGTVYIGDVLCGQSPQAARVFVRNSFGPYVKPTAFQVQSGNLIGSNIAGHFTANATGSFNVGVYSTSIPVNSSNPGNYPTLGNYAAYFNGDVFISGMSYINGFFNFSDQNLKTDIDTVENALEIINQLKPHSFKYDSINHPEMNFSTKKQYGFIAQEVENVLPELIGIKYSSAVLDSNGNLINTPVEYKTMNYMPLIAILTKGIQEQNGKIDSLEALTNSQDSINNALQDQINTLYGMITACCNNNSNMSQNNSMQQNQNDNSLDVTLTDNIPSIVLDQNVPNPFAEQTTITYTLTDGVQKAQMLFYNIEGKLIQSAELLNTAGQGQINVFANDLSTGVYTYSLVVDGQIKGTKRMVKQ